MRKLWNKWCDMVDEHNRLLDSYVFQEEIWSPYTIFMPIVMAVIISVLIMLMSVGYCDIGMPPIAIFSRWILWIFITSIGFGFFLFLNWKRFSFHK